MSPPDSLWRNRPFNLLWDGQTINSLGTMVSSIALPLVALEHLDASTFQVGLLAAIQWVPALLFGLLAGVYVDRHRRRPTMMWANLGQAVAIGLVPASAAVGLLSFPLLLIAASLSGLFGVFFQTAYSPYLRTIVATKHLADANGKLRSSRSVASISGPALDGMLIQGVGAAAAVLADAASFLVSFLLLWRVGSIEPPIERSTGDTSIRSAIKEGIIYLARVRLLRDVTLVLAAVNFLLTAAGALEIVFLTRVVHIQPSTIGILLACGAVGGLCGALVSGHVTKQFGLYPTARLILCFTAPLGLLLPLAQAGPMLILFAVGLFGMSFGIAIATVTFATIRQLASPPEILGRVSATPDLLMSASLPTGALVGGALGTWIGPRFALLAILAATATLGILLALSGKLAEPEEDHELSSPDDGSPARSR